jgi:hypothetical protein
VTGRIWKEQTNPDGACIPNLCSWAKETIEKREKIVLFGWLVISKLPWCVFIIVCGCCNVVP